MKPHENYENFYIKIPPRRIPKAELFVLLLSRRICLSVRAVYGNRWGRNYYRGAVYVAQPRQKDGILTWRVHRELFGTASWSFNKTMRLTKKQCKKLPITNARHGLKKGDEDYE